MQELLLPAVDTFYDCVEHEFDYQRAVETLSRAADDTGFVFSENWPLCGNRPPLGSHNIPQDCLDVLVDGGLDLQSHDAFQKFMLIPEQTPTLLRSHMSIEDHYETRLHQEAAKPWGMHCEGVTILNKSTENSLACWFVRYPGQSEVVDELSFQIAFLSKQLSRAIALQNKIDQLNEALRVSNNVLDLINFGLVLYGKKEAPVYINRAAREIFDADDGIGLGKSNLIISDRNANKKLDTLSSMIRNGYSHFSARSGQAILAHRPSGKRAYSLIAIPLAKYKKFGMDNVNMVVMIFDPYSKSNSTVNLFASSYGLTSAESMLAIELAHGISLDEFTAKKGISTNTARTQLKSIFAKTETSRQHELVSVLLRSIANMNLE
ncbi:helix-turn-helix transcriptional regulator [Lentilitoribacter sp. Alg239-R112]|uniref:helix-turn-helix transcriptional regulator n=1 Tax=Lentilitoribacter sp. Alg239-R112 TaxID=2305987 RepID=UPI0013A704CF|nr:helix-turn-helix transcriptional regulator [Lentilitoribacter sp. Alg239-R112]